MQSAIALHPEPDSLALTPPCATPGEAVRWSYALKNAHRWRMENPDRSAVALLFRSVREGETRVRLWLGKLPDEGRPSALLVGGKQVRPFANPANSRSSTALVMVWPRFEGRAPDLDVVDLFSCGSLFSSDERPASRLCGSSVMRFALAERDGEDPTQISILTAGPGQPFAPRWPGDLEMLSARSDGQRWEKPTDDQLCLEKTKMEQCASLFVRKDKKGRLFRVASGQVVDPRDKLRIVVRPNALREGLVIGRALGDASSDDPAQLGISRVHAVLFYRDARLWVVDMGSTNGTYIDSLNGEFSPFRLTAELGRVWPLDVGEKVLVGGKEVVLRMTTEKESAKSGC
jgi:hypothetical protein